MKKKLNIFILFLILIFSLFGCGKTKTKEEYIDTYSFHTDLQEAYLNDKYDLYSLYAKGVEELSIPKKISFEIGSENKSYHVSVSENKNLENPIIIDTESNILELSNLKMNTIYYYSVDGGDILKFKTDSKGPRNLDIDGLTNVRDVGGWNGSNQGLIYRSSKFNKDESTELIITEKGIDIFLNELKVKTEIDLRKVDENGGLTESPLGPSVKYISIPMSSGGNIMTLNKDKLKDLFKVFGDESNYPIVFHCSIGTDRTGLVSFLINGLLGASKEDLMRDYLFSNFGNIGKVRTPNIIETYFITLNNFSSGDTIKDKIYNYLINNGVEKEDIDTLIKMMSK